jgi:hypothetical protein
MISNSSLVLPHQVTHLTTALKHHHTISPYQNYKKTWVVDYNFILQSVSRWWKGKCRVLRTFSFSDFVATLVNSLMKVLFLARAIFASSVAITIHAILVDYQALQTDRAACMCLVGGNLKKSTEI